MAQAKLVSTIHSININCEYFRGASDDMYLVLLKLLLSIKTSVEFVRILRQCYNNERSNKLNLRLFYMLLLLSLCFNFANGLSLEDLSKIRTPDMIKNEGYPAEEHEVITKDGYILTVYRIPGSSGSTPVLIQHGLFSNSFDWVVAGRNKALAFILADKGYDVWLGNARGSTNSRKHVRLDPSDPQFWDFSFHEMGVYDLPAVITYITNLKNRSLIYIGHSMGTTMSYIMATERQDMTDRVKVMFSFAPIAILHKWKSPLRLLSKYAYQLEDFAKRLRIYEFLPQNMLSRMLLQQSCQVLSENNLCIQLMFYIGGYNPSQFNYTLLPMILSHTPAGSSLKTVFHYAQMSRVGRFQKYDYRPNRNKILYNSFEPPEYNLSKIQIPVGIFWSDNDLFCHPMDALTFYKAVPNKVLNYRIPSRSFTHTDFMWAMDAPKLLYSKLVSVMEDYR